MPILGTRTLHWPDEAACRETAAQLARRPACRRAFIEMQGPLGAGKTTFVRHLLRAFGVQGRIKSPTYAVMEPYELPAADGSPPSAAWHFDFYRFDEPIEWEDAGFREIFAAEGLKLAEWPQQAEGLLPDPDLRIVIEPQGLETTPDGSSAPRTVTLHACTTLGLELLP